MSHWRRRLIGTRRFGPHSARHQVISRWRCVRPIHFGAMYRLEDGSGGCFSASAGWTATTCTAEQPHNNAYGFNFGGVIAKFSADVVYQRVFQAISVLNPL